MWGRRQFGRHFKRQFGEGDCESKIAARQWALRSVNGPRSQRMVSPEAGSILWTPLAWKEAHKVVSLVAYLVARSVDHAAGVVLSISIGLTPEYCGKRPPEQ